MTIQLDSVVPWGRSLAEYRLMFALSDADLDKTIVGVSDGPASFNAEMTAQGKSVLSVDPVYAFRKTEIESRIAATYNTIVDQLKASPENFVWHQFQDPDDLGAQRMQTMSTFLVDYDAGKLQHRYQVGALPYLPLVDNQFELALCSHFLFLYSNHVSLELHITAVRELLRVAEEVRIFPLIDLEMHLSRHLAPVLAELEHQGQQYAIETVDYEFQRGGNQMLRIW